MNEKLSNMFNLLAGHKFSVIGEISDDFKCVICKEILVNAQQSLCGCHFCLVCIDNYKKSGSKNCPGNTDECKCEDLSNIFIDPRINKRISNLAVRCHHENCSHECRLIEMEDHMRFCSITSIHCPFNNVGCEHEDMNIDKLNEHMLLEIVNHNKILIDINSNLRNEVRELKEKEERNRKEIKILKANDCKKDDKLELLMKEINLIKKEKEDLAYRMEICNSNLWNSFDRIDKEMKDKCTNDVKKLINDEVKLLKMEKKELSQQIDISKRNFDDNFNVQMNVKLNEMKQEWNDKFENQTIETNKINKYLNMRDDGLLRWQIGKIKEMDWMSSVIFYDKQNPYKMKLGLWNETDKLVIWLSIWPGAFDADLKWPCRANITIYIIACDGNDVIEKSMTESIIIDKLENNSFKESKDLKFSHSELKESKHFNKNCLLECKVKFD